MASVDDSIYHEKHRAQIDAMAEAEARYLAPPERRSLKTAIAKRECSPIRPGQWGGASSC